MKHNVLVFSSLFPSSVAPANGLFIRERMFKVAEHVNLTVVSPVPWFPGQNLIRIFKKNYRNHPEKLEIQRGIVVYFPRFLAFPGIFRNLDAFLMYASCFFLVRKLKREKGIEIIDSHFTYPDGLAATLLAQSLGLKSVITLRGTEIPHSKIPGRKKQLIQAWLRADKLVAVSNSLAQHAINHGADEKKTMVIGNGIDTGKFYPIDRSEAKDRLGIRKDQKVIITVGGLVERKGFHRVVECLPDLLIDHPDLVYLIVGGGSVEGNYEGKIRALADSLTVMNHIRFLGVIEPDELRLPLSAADVFVLSSSNEGWANVILESIACATPVVATDVGGNSEVIASESLGFIVPFGERLALLNAIKRALQLNWDGEPLIQYAQDNSWINRVSLILDLYDNLREENRLRSSD